MSIIPLILQTTPTVKDVTIRHTTAAALSSVPVQSMGGRKGGGNLYVGVGVSIGVLLVLLATGTVVIVVSVWVWLKKNKHVTVTDNAAYGAAQEPIKLSDNAAYGAGQEAIELSDNAAYSNAIELNGNAAYYVVNQKTIELSGNAAHVRSSISLENTSVADEELVYDYVSTNNIAIVTSPDDEHNMAQVVM